MPFRLQKPALVCLWLLLAAPLFAGDSAVDRTDVHPASPRQQEATYKIQAGMDGEIYPVFANYASLLNQSQRSFGVVAVTITNPGTTAFRRRVAVMVNGWSDEEIQVAEVPAGSAKTLLFAPSFLPRFYRNLEIVAATVRVSVTDMVGKSVYESTAPVHLRSAEDILWGSKFKYAPFIASWVTPHSPAVEEVLAEAKSYTPDQRLPGYENWKSPAEQEAETYIEAKAIFTALKRMGLSYVKSSLTLGGHKSMSERVRMPSVSLRQSSANCIDAVVMYASLFENLGMAPSVIIVPGHAYVGVRVANTSSKFLFIDAALTGRASFEVAVASARSGMNRNAPASRTEVMVEEARSAGIYPMP